MDLLTLSAHLPEVPFAPVEFLVREGQRTGAMWILLSGALEVRKGEVLVNTVTRQGAVIGEISLLLHTNFSATVVASEPSVVRFAADGQALLLSDPTITRLVAVGLAERLHVVTSYLADPKQQYGDARGCQWWRMCWPRSRNNRRPRHAPARRAIPIPITEPALLKHRVLRPLQVGQVQ